MVVGDNVCFVGIVRGYHKGRSFLRGNFPQTEMNRFGEPPQRYVRRERENSKYHLKSNVILGGL